MKKLILASAVSVLFACPAVVLAQARAGSAPTLDKVLEASGLSVNGYMDIGYTRANRNLEGGTPGGVSTRVFDSQNDSFALHQLGLTMAKQPREGFGGLVNLTIGKDAQVIQSFPDTSGSLFDVTQAYAQYATGPFTLIGGKFTTLHGTEVIASPGNANISRSILFGAVPFTHTGVRGTWALSDTVSLIAGVNNGWDQLTDRNRGKTLELGASLSPIKPLTIAVSAYTGKEPASPTTPGNDGTRNSIDTVASYSITDALNVGGELLYVTQENVAGNKVKYNGAAGYVSYMFAPRWRGAARVELFDDKNGFHFGTVGGTKYTEGTVTGSYFAADSMELRAEGRLDRANNAVFVPFNGGTSKNLVTVALQGLYKF